MIEAAPCCNNPLRALAHELALESEANLSERPEHRLFRLSTVSPSWPLSSAYTSKAQAHELAKASLTECQDKDHNGTNLRWLSDDSQKF